MPPLLFLYGSLRRGGAAHLKLSLDRRLRFLMPSVVRGRLFDLGDYPAFVAGDRLVQGELFEPLDEAVVVDLDAYEEVDPLNPAGGLYVREPIALVGSPRQADIYRFNGSVDGFPEIPSGDWIAYRAARDGRR